MLTDGFANQSPTIIAIGGGPASGKTTLRCKLQAELPHYFLHDMDEELVKLPEYQKDLIELGAKQAFQNWWPLARERSEESVREAIASRQSILYDRTCGAESSYKDLLRAKNEGYFIRLTGLTVDRQLASERARIREATTGRAMTEEIIDEYRARFSALWPLYLTFVDEAFLYDTTQNPPLLIYSSKDGVLHPDLYQRFLNEGKL